jgi:hypothetical protein
MVETLQSISKNFLHKSLDVCLQNNSSLQKIPDDFLILKNGKFKKIIQKTLPDYDFFVEHTISKKLVVLPQFEILNMVVSEKPLIKEYYRNFQGERSGNYPLDVQEYTNQLPIKFLIRYLQIQNKFTYDENIFSKVFKEFNYFLENFSQDEYIMPLYNFSYKGELKPIKFGTITLRPITSKELKFISEYDDQKKINRFDSELTHVLVMYISSKNIGNGFNHVKPKFQLFLDALTLNFKGDLRLGRIFSNINYTWKSFDKSQKIDVFSQQNKLNFSQNDSDSFRIFFNTLKKSNIFEPENLFLMMAINRFRTGLTRTSLEDRIIDFITSLESLYASGSGDITRKLSQRGSMLLSKNEESREDVYNFIKSAYNFRSGLVHGEGQREVTINGERFTLRKICDDLEDLNRKSIRIYLKLVKHYSGKNKNKKIIDDIDNSLINRQKFMKLKQKF